MISKRELAERLCEVEELAYYLHTDLDKLERRVKKLEPKKERKSKKNETKKSDLLSLILDNADVIGEENIGGESRSMKKGRKKNETQK